MIELNLEISKGEDFSVFLPATNLLGSTVKSEFGTVEHGEPIRVGDFSATIQPSGIRLTKLRSEIESIRNGAYRFDVLVERPDAHFPDGKSLSVEYRGILQVG
ncbi:hypothetical protein EHQ12_04015 [Leptospira gomenensis]|uniref:Uncharacterized protein n=1 Tax=Leptospira gomenensis TaxID=2484974 RepID=A0A5F1YDL1_9LEPT|nr:hypothetical protein EHQ17_04705 [Leptospira gomenensis]TGK42745.1 hypothetical protein EHQ07_13795 [Leptospira gomenensis]TGK42932.1 hypothetical protein EHQ12_04015 [Leptospira gomenensis]TGK54944.1 hypothetical protein EHQ13_18270 [Leptospira gomenensis]